MTTLLIVDDHVLIREGLRRALTVTDFDVIGEAASLSEAKIRYEALQPAAILIDLNLGDGSGLDFAEWVRKKSPNCAIIVLTMDDRAEVLARAKQVGVNAYVLKEAPLNELVSALNFVISNPRKFFTAARVKPTLTKLFDLTARESEILALLPEGLSNREMASLLFISEATIKTHLLSLYRELKVKNRIQAIEVARSNNLLSH